MQEFIGWPCRIRFIGESCDSGKPTPPDPVPGPLDYIENGTGLDAITAK